jgi:uncharacterized protein YndB with AHSA1/START domain
MTISKDPLEGELESADSAAAADAPGAIPPTGGVPPQDAPPATTGTRNDRSAADDLVDSIDLMLRAARSALQSVEPRIEATAEQALVRLRLFDETVETSSRRTAAHDRKQLEAIATDAGREIAALVERVAERVESALQFPDGRGHARVDTASVVVAAKADDVYRAFSDPRALVVWLPPGGMTGRVLDYDFREGGRYRIELTYAWDVPAEVGKTTGRTDISAGRFVSLMPGKRIVQSVEFESPDDSFAGEMTMTWSFEALPAGTRVTVTAENVPHGIAKADHDTGLRASLQNLAHFLASGSPRPAHETTT